jgi:hypothetical protein
MSIPASIATWLVAALVLCPTVLPIFMAGDSAHIVAIGMLVLDILGLLAARGYYQRLDLALTAAMKKRRSNRNLEIDHIQARQTLTHALGMGFGVSAVLVAAYLAYIYGF